MTSDFAFKSGGRYHFSGFGEWVLKVKSKLVMVEHFVGDEIDTSEVLKLEEEDYNALMEEISNLEKLASSVRAGQPDEPIYEFVFNEEGITRNIGIWANDASKDLNIQRFIEIFKEIVEMYLKKQCII
ncbi:MAG: hypothetical protein ACXAD7_22560 [Candidatus Kariarchaeaceae archaeon]|jgi:hypothetical protein